jgi:hypothetical protein
MALFTTALGLYGGVLWSGELQGFILHEMIPAFSFQWPVLDGPCRMPNGTKYLVLSINSACRVFCVL